MSLPNLKTVMENAAYAAGKAVMEIYNMTQNEVEYKADNSPVTVADQEAETIIIEALKEHYKDIPIVAEEAASNGDLPDISDSSFFLVDALDGTKEFICKKTDFTINIALIENGLPVSGIVYAPALEIAWICDQGKAEKITLIDGKESSRESIHVRKTQNGPEIAVVSHSHSNDETENYLKNFNITQRTSAGSSLKFCLIAEGSADIYPRFGRTMEWDTAAGEAVLKAAGGRVVLQDGSTLLPYGKTNQANDTDFANPFFIADSG